MATYYVKTTGNDGTGDGSSGNPWASLGYAVTQTANGDTIYIEAGTYTFTTTTPGAAGPIVTTSAHDLLIEGYESTPGDGCPTGNRPVIDCATYGTGAMFHGNGTSSGQPIIMHLEFDGNGQANTYCVRAQQANYSFAYDCIVRDNAGTASFYLLICSQCVSITSTLGFFNSYCNFCRATGGTSHGFSGGTADWCISDNNDGVGYGAAYGKRMVGDISYGNGSHGFAGLASLPGLFDNCISINDGGIAFSGRAILLNCASYNPSGGRTDANVAGDIGAIALSGDPFVNAATGDFNIDNTANEGALLRAATFIMPA